MANEELNLKFRESLEHGVFKLEEREFVPKVKPVHLIILGILVIIIGTTCVVYATGRPINEILDLQALIAKKQIQLVEDIAKYGWDMYHLSEQIRNLQITLETYRQPIYPYRNLGFVVMVIGVILLGIGIQEEKKTSELKI